VSLGGQQTQPSSPGYRFGTALCVQFAHNGVNMELYSMFAHTQPVGNSFVGKTLRQQEQDFQLPGCQTHGWRRDTRGASIAGDRGVRHQQTLGHGAQGRRENVSAGAPARTPLEPDARSWTAWASLEAIARTGGAPPGRRPRFSMAADSSQATSQTTTSGP